MIKNKKIVVTGGAGFIGSNLCNTLIEAGNKVVCIDNLSTGSVDNIDHLAGRDDFKLLVSDVTSMSCLTGLDFGSVDMIFHLACPASPPKYQSDMVKTLKTSTVGTINVLDYARLYDIPVLFSSTSEVYGDPDKYHVYQNEEYWGNVNPMGIRSCYDEGKRCAEALCFSYHRQYKVQAKVVRLFNTYGPHMNPDDGRIVSNFIMQALRGEPITIYGTGKQNRSYCYVDDTVRGLILAMEHPSHVNNDGKLVAINIGNPSECVTVLEVAKKIKKLTGSKSELVYIDLPEDDPHMRRPAINSALAYLNWKPEITFDKGLEKTIEHFKKFV